MRMPPKMQADLHRDGFLDDPDYKYDKEGRLTANAEKVRRYIEKEGEPWF